MLAQVAPKPSSRPDHDQRQQSAESEERDGPEEEPFHRLVPEVGKVPTVVVEPDSRELSEEQDCNRGTHDKGGSADVDVRRPAPLALERPLQPVAPPSEILGHVRVAPRRLGHGRATRRARRTVANATSATTASHRLCIGARSSRRSRAMSRRRERRIVQGRAIGARPSTQDRGRVDLPSPRVGRRRNGAPVPAEPEDGLRHDSEVEEALAAERGHAPPQADPRARAQWKASRPPPRRPHE